MEGLISGVSVPQGDPQAVCTPPPVPTMVLVDAVVSAKVSVAPTKAEQAAAFVSPWACDEQNAVTPPCRFTQLMAAQACKGTDHCKKKGATLPTSLSDVLVGATTLKDRCCGGLRGIYTIM